MQSPLSARLGQEDRRFLKATDKGHLLRECNYAAAADSIFQLNQNMETSNVPRTERKERHWTHKPSAIGESKAYAKLHSN